MRTRSLLLASLCCSLLQAQTTPPEAGVGIDGQDGVLRAAGPDYTARFEASGVTFTPALGVRVQAPATMHCRLEHVRRGSARVFEATQPVPPSVHDRQVRYQHSAQLREVHDVRRDGIEQSFVFAERPAGVGDLVVGLCLTTDLVLTEATATGLCFERPGVGGVCIGAVTGIDANGARAAGTLRVDGSLLELCLPAAFVDTAAYPLVVDPMIGSNVTLGNGAAGIDRQPSVAFDETSQRYLVVWNVELSATDAEVWAQFVTALGNPVGNAILVDGNARTGLRPAVASINDSNRFLLAWGRAAMQGTTPYTQARYASMTASNGTLSASTYFAGNATTTPTGLAVGGNSRESAVVDYEDALVAATLHGTNDTAYCWPVSVPATGNPVAAGGLTQLDSTAGTLASLAVTKHAGNGGRWMVTFVRTVGLSGVVRMSLVDANATLCQQATLPSPGLVGSAAVATRDGFEFLVAYENSGLGQLGAHRCSYTGGCGAGVLTIGALVDPVQAPGVHAHPELECVRDKYVMSWEARTSASATSDIRVRGLSLVDGSPAGAIYYAGGTSTPLLGEQGSAIASRWSGGDTTSDEALVVWSSGVIVGRRFEAIGAGTVTSLGGACGTTGLNDFASYSGTPALGTSFTIELLAQTAPVLALIVGFSQAPFACGPCTIVPSGDVLLPGGAPVQVDVPMVPQLIGFELYAQWMQLRPSGCPLLPGFGFSNTLKFTVAE